MAQSFACRIFPQNLPLGGKGKFASVAPTEGNNTLTMLYTPTLATIVVSTIVFALSSVA